MSISRNLSKSLGGRWTYRYPGSWDCDDGKRYVIRYAAGFDDPGNDLGPSQMWLYGDGVPRRAEEYCCVTTFTSLFG